MAQYEACIGIGASLVINTEGTRMKYLFEDLQKAGVNTIDPGDAHVTIVYPHEIMFPVESKPEEIALARVREGVGSLLSQAEASQEVFDIRSHEIEPLGYRRSRVGIFLTNSRWFSDMREQIGDLFHSETGLHMISNGKPFEAHLALGAIKGQRVDKKSSRDARVPSRIHATGFTVTEENIKVLQQNGGGRPKNDRHFRNHPRGSSSHS